MKTVNLRQILDTPKNPSVVLSDSKRESDAVWTEWINYIPNEEAGGKEHLETSN